VKFYTEEECELWLQKRHRTLPVDAGFRVEYGAGDRRLAFFAKWIADHLPYKQPVLVLITEWGIWPSSENWHLYYLLRTSHGEHRLLDEAPGHLFLEYEAADLTSFLQLAMMNGWGGYLLTEANYVNAFFSHDEHIDFYAENAGNLIDVRDAFK
jgi:hypothetical protein